MSDALAARLRFGARASNTLPRFDLGGDVPVWADVRAVDGQALTDADVVTFIVYRADGTILSPAPTVTRESAGIYTTTLTPDQAGTWAVTVDASTANFQNDTRRFFIASDLPVPAVVGPNAVVSVNGIAGPNPVIGLIDLDGSADAIEAAASIAGAEAAAPYAAAAAIAAGQAITKASEAAASAVAAEGDRIATAADRVQTGLDSATTAADRVQTGLDRTAATGSADDAAGYAATALGVITFSEAFIPYFSDDPNVAPSNVDSAGYYDAIGIGVASLAVDVGGLEIVTARLENDLPRVEFFTDLVTTPARIDAAGYFDGASEALPGIDFRLAGLESTATVTVPFFTDVLDAPSIVDAAGFYDATPLDVHAQDARITALEAESGITDLATEARGTGGSRGVWLASPLAAPFLVSTPDVWPGDNWGPVAESAASLRWARTNAGVTTIERRRLDLAAASLAVGVTTITLVVYIGQSTSNGISAASALTTPPPVPGRVLMWSNAGQTPRILGTDHSPDEYLTRVPAGNLLSLVDARESLNGSSGETQCTACGVELQARLGSSHAVVVATVGIGSQPEENLRVATPIGQNLMDIVRATRLVAMLRGLAFRTVIVYPQSEAEYARSQADWVWLLRGVDIPGVGFHQPYRDAIRVAVDDAARGLLLCVNGYANPTAYGSATSEEPLGQLQAALDYPTNIIYSTSGYVAPTTGDLVHRTAAGNRLLGSYDGRTIAHALLAQDARPLHTTGVSVGGGVATATVFLPVGGVGLTSTSPIVSDPGNLGLTLSRQDNGVAVPISAAAVASGTTYTVTPTAPPAGVPLWLEVGYRGTPGVGAGPTTGVRTPLNDGHADVALLGGASLANHHAIQRIAVTF